jgi:hypothetical protein
VKLSAKDKAKLIPRLALRWSRLLTEDVCTDGFWQDMSDVLDRDDFEFTDAEVSTIKGWVREWAARVTRLF